MTIHAHDEEHQPQHGSKWPDMIELEADALREITDDITTWIADLVATPPGHLVDLGSGTGAGTFALLKRFPQARVTALDSSPQMLERLDRRAAELDQPGRVVTVEADLDGQLLALSDVDLVWASSALHHLQHADDLIAQVAGVLDAGGWFVVVEAEDVPFLLPDDLGMGRPGLEQRCHDVLSRFRAAQMPDAGVDWGARLTSAGFFVRDSRLFEATLRAPLADIDPRGLARRNDLTLRATRKTWAGQLVSSS